MRNLAAMAMGTMVVAAGCGATSEAPVAYYEAPAIEVVTKRARTVTACYEAPAIEVVASRAPTLSYEAPVIVVLAKAPAREESLAW